MKVVGKIIAVLYSIIFTVVLFSVSIAICASNLLKGSFYTDILKNIDLKEISASDLGITSEPNESLQDVIVKELTDAGLDKSISEEILNNNEIKEVVGDVIGQVINYTIDGEVVPKITEEQAKIVLENKNVKELLDTEFTEEDVKELVKELNEFLNEFADNGGLNGN